MEPSASTYTGLRVGSYRLIKRIGEGNFATVYVGKHRHLGTYAAVKILRNSLDRAEVSRFRHEALIAAHLRHPNIMRVQDYGTAGTTPYIVMDYAPYGSLCRQHRPGMMWRPQDVLAYVHPIASALRHIHQSRLIHRDVKPANVLLGYHRQVLLSDFGIALLELSADNGADRIGTIDYMAPEQIDGAPCFASDQYALAVMTYEWLCGWRPFYGSTYEIAEQHLTLPPPLLRARVPWLSEEIEDVVLRALAKDPADRFSSVSEFARRLEQAVDRSSAFMETGALPRVQVSLPESRPAGRSVQQTRTQQERWETMEYEEANQEPRQPPLWRKIAVLVGLGMIIELTVYVILAMLGMDLHSFWSLLASCILALPLVISYTRDHRRSFLLTGVVLIASLLGGLLTHSLWVLFSTYLVLLATLLGSAFYRHRRS